MIPTVPTYPYAKKKRDIAFNKVFKCNKYRVNIKRPLSDMAATIMHECVCGDRVDMIFGLYSFSDSNLGALDSSATR